MRINVDNMPIKRLVVKPQDKPPHPVAFRALLLVRDLALRLAHFWVEEKALRLPRAWVFWQVAYPVVKLLMLEGT